MPKLMMLTFSQVTTCSLPSDLTLNPSFIRIALLFFYIFPYKPDFYILFRVFLRILYPYVIYVILERNYAKTKYAISHVEKRKNITFNTTLMLLTVLLIMLVSCNFKYGALVIGSNSMRGSINKGDTIVYTTYDDTMELKAGDVIVFNKRNYLKCLN